MLAKMNPVSKLPHRAILLADRMKKAFRPAIFVVITLSLLTACSASSSDATAAVPALAADSELAVGTLKLEGTAQAIDAKEAADLLPLWQLLDELRSSSSTAQEELDAVVEQIWATMTAEQASAIEEMGLTQADALTAMQSQASAGSSSASTTSSTRSNSQGAAPGGGPGFAGGPPPDAGGGAAGMILDAGLGGAASSSTTSTSSQSSTAAGSGAQPS